MHWAEKTGLDPPVPPAPPTAPEDELVAAPPWPPDPPPDELEDECVVVDPAELDELAVELDVAVDVVRSGSGVLPQAPTASAPASAAIRSVVVFMIV